MDASNQDNWDGEYYKELNIYFRIRIEQLLRTNPQLQEADNLQLSDLVAQFSNDDRERWEDFLRLDKQKMEIDMWNHLHGNGTRFQPGLGFTNPDDDTTW